MIRISPLRRFLSLFHPTVIWHGPGAHTPELELCRYQGRWQLAAGDALYSDGAHYRPIALAIRRLRHRLPQQGRTLVLGSGLGSAAIILLKAGYQHQVTLVDWDEVILRLASETLPPAVLAHTNLIAANAESFFTSQHQLYDLIILDLFIGRSVPPFAISISYLQQVQKALLPGGVLVLNFMVTDQHEWEKLHTHMTTLFPYVRVIMHGINHIILASDRDLKAS